MYFILLILINFFAIKYTLLLLFVSYTLFCCQYLVIIRFFAVIMSPREVTTNSTYYNKFVSNRKQNNQIIYHCCYKFMKLFSLYFKEIDVTNCKYTILNYRALFSLLFLHLSYISFYSRSENRKGKPIFIDWLFPSHFPHQYHRMQLVIMMS